MRRYVIIGDGAAGTTAAETLRARDASASIVIVSDDPQPAYFRAALTNYLLGELAEHQIWAVPPTFYDEHAIHRILGRVLHVDTARQEVHLSQGGRPLGYDALLIAAGSRARPAPFDGAWLPGVMTMRTLHDVRRVMDLVGTRSLRHAVIAGGGPLALEWAHGLLHRGVKVTMVIREQKLLPTTLDKVASDLLLARLRHAQVNVLLGDEITHALPHASGRVGGIVTRAGVRLECELIGVAIGVVCNSEFLQSAPISLTPHGAVQVDTRLRTSAPQVFAAGDIAAVDGKLLQLWEPARGQAKCAAINMSGGQATYAPGAHYMATRLYDLDFASIGHTTGGAGIEELVDFPQRTGQVSYRKLCLQGHRVVGALLFGERSARVRRSGRAYKELIDRAVAVERIKGQLLDPTFDIGSWLRTQELVHNPVHAARGPVLASGAELKGTRALRLSELPPPSAQAPSAPRAEATEVRAWLESAEARVDIAQASIVVGSAPTCSLVARGASAQHAEFSRHGPAIYVRDLGSATGTWIGGQAVTMPRRLRDGERIRIGQLELTFRMQATGLTPPPPSIDSTTQPPSAEPTPHLDVSRGRSLGLGFELVASSTVIGRAADCTIRLEDESVDARHAFVQRGPQGWAVTDAESHGVTRHNDMPIQPGQWVLLREGDRIDVGDASLVYRMRHARLPELRAPHAAARPSGPSCGRCGTKLGLEDTHCKMCGAARSPMTAPGGPS